MDSGFYAACAGLRAQSQALEVAAHNLANVNTTGFRGEQTTFQSLVALARPTAPNPLDVGIEGKGFFVVQTPHGTRYTRNGSFRVSSIGELVTGTGDPVLGTSGVIRLPAGPVTISPDGTISVNGAVAGQIRLADFPAGTKLSSEGGSLLAAPAGNEQRAQQASLRQAAVESSNVDAISSVVTLIGVQREAEMLGRAMSLFDTEFNHIAASELGKV